MMYAVNFPIMRECESQREEMWQICQLLNRGEACSRWRVVPGGRLF